MASQSTIAIRVAQTRVPFASLVALAAFALTSNLQAATITWNVSSGNWSTTTNWNPNGALLTTSNVVFGATGSAANSSTITNTADATVTIDTLTYNQNSATNWQNTHIGSGVTVNVGGTTNAVMTIGLTSNATTNATISGLGALNVVKTGGTVQIGAATGSNGNTTTLNMSDLTSFTANLGTTGIFRIGDPATGAAVTSNTVVLGKTTEITAGILGIADETGTQGSKFLKLGSTLNTINANTINVGGVGASTRSGAEISFNSATGDLKVRTAADPVNGRAVLNLVNAVSGTAGTLSSKVDLTGHSSDVRLSTLTMASRTAGTGGSNATFSFDSGLLDVTSIIMSRATGSATGTQTSTLNIGGGTANIGSIAMAQSLGTTTANATINLTGGTTKLTGNITRTGGGISTATINLDGGTLNMSGFSIGAANAVTLNAKAGTLSNLLQLNSGGTLTKTTTGTLIVSGTNSYTGATNITDGKLLMNGTHSGGGTYTVAVNGTLGGSGTINGAAINLFGAVSPGNSSGTLSADNFNWQNGGTYEWEVTNAAGTAGVGWDLLDLTGGNLVFVGGGTYNIDLDISAASLSLPSYDFEIARANGISNFNAMNFLFSDINAGDYAWSIYQQGNSLFLHAALPAPEPSSLAMWALLGTGLATIRRRSKRMATGNDQSSCQS